MTAANLASVTAARVWRRLATLPAITDQALRNARRLTIGTAVLTVTALHTVFGQVVSNRTTDPTQFVITFNRHVSAELGASGLTEIERTARFANLLDEGLDLDAVGERLLGWRWALAPALAHALFEEQLRHYLISAFALRTTGMAAGRMIVQRVVAQDDAFLVQTLVDTDEATDVPFDWLVIQSASGWRLCDIAVKNVSMAAVMRSQFESILGPSAADFSPLLRVLAKKASE